MDTTHELFEILADSLPQWQDRYPTLREAAVAAQCLPEYYAYLATSEGRLRAIRHADVPDTYAANRAEQKARNRMLKRMIYENDDIEENEFGTEG